MTSLSRKHAKALMGKVSRRILPVIPRLTRETVVILLALCQQFLATLSTQLTAFPSIEGPVSLVVATTVPSTLRTSTSTVACSLSTPTTWSDVCLLQLAWSAVVESSVDIFHSLLSATSKNECVQKSLLSVTSKS